MNKIQRINAILYKYDPWELEGAPPDEYMSEAQMIAALPHDLSYNKLYSEIVKVFTKMFGPTKIYRLAKLREATKQIYFEQKHYEK